MRIHDNHTPAGRWVGDNPPLAPRIPACCRDGYARQSLIRPLWMGRPGGSGWTEDRNWVTNLCRPCLRARLHQGAHTLDLFDA